MKKLLNVFLIAFCALLIACNKQTLSSYTIEMGFADMNDSNIVAGRIEPNVEFENLTLPATRSKYKSYIANARIFNLEVFGSILHEEDIEITSSEIVTNGIIYHTKSDLGLGSLACFQGSCDLFRYPISVFSLRTIIARW